MLGTLHILLPINFLSHRKYFSYMTPKKLKLRWLKTMCFRIEVWTQTASASRVNTLNHCPVESDKLDYITVKTWAIIGMLHINTVNIQRIKATLQPGGPHEISWESLGLSLIFSSGFRFSLTSPDSIYLSPYGVNWLL